MRAALLLLASFFLAACATPAVDLVVRNVTIYPGEGAPFTGAVVVRDGVFAAVSRDADARFDAATTIDGAGLFLTPGLWDMHTHLRLSRERRMSATQFITHGVTSARDLGALTDDLKALEVEIAAGAVGPSIYSSYAPLNGEAFGDFQRAVTTEAEVIAAVDELAASGAVQIKIHRALAPALLPVVIQAAHARSLTLTGHIPLGVHPLTACEAGMDGVEHISSFLEAYVSVTLGARTADAITYMLSDAAAPLYACLGARGVEVAPTLVVYAAVARARYGDAPPPQAQEFIAGVGRIALRLHQEGVPLLAGTDTSDLDAMVIAPGSSLLEELEMLQHAGIAPRDLIAIATLNAARALGMDDRTGAIAPGQAADFLVLAADPGEDVRAFRALRAVYRGGEAVHVTRAD